MEHGKNRKQAEVIVCLATDANGVITRIIEGDDLVRN
ncbi:Hypothetical protein Tpal_2514 [Trichococcus palustris]|uniref:Uncharacterized protein n=1 Tax=Trichococcus palustris TaxID=140314 RepID=A0A143YZ72_9LACT|nr:Hypothetical protein Tpal_2514 [Trichococcus palustris]